MAKSKKATTFEEFAKQEGEDYNPFAAERRRKSLFKVYNDEKKMKVTISPLYQPWFGKVMALVINGYFFSIPCDGQAYEVPETFGVEALRRVQEIDNQQKRARNMSQATGNVESAPGDLRFFNA